MWGGLANMDEYEGHAPFGLIQGMTVRLYDPATRQWRLHWANRATGVFDAPMVGRFEDGRGEFYNQELHEGRAVYARFIWSDITATCLPVGAGAVARRRQDLGDQLDHGDDAMGAVAGS